MALRIGLIVGVAALLLLGSVVLHSGDAAISGRSAALGTDATDALANATVVATIPLPGPFLTFPALFVPQTADLYLIATGGIDVVNGSTGAYVGQIPAGFGSSVIGDGLAYDPANRELYVPWENLTIGPESGHAFLDAFSTESGTLTAQIPLSSGALGIQSPEDVAMYDPANGNVYVPLAGTPGAVAVVSGTSNTLLRELTVGSLPYTPVLDSSTGDLYVVNSASQNISVISGSTDTVVASISLGSAPADTEVSEASIDGPAQTLFATSTFSSSPGGVPTAYLQGVSLASRSVFANRSLSFGPSPPFLDYELNEVLVGTNFNVTAFNASDGEPIATIPTEPLLSSPGYLALNAPNQLVYATSINPLGFTVVSLLTDRDVANVTVSTNADTFLTAPVFDSDNGEVFLPMEVGSSAEVLVIGAGAPSSGSSSAFETPFLIGLGIGAAAVVVLASVLVRRSRRVRN